MVINEYAVHGWRGGPGTLNFPNRRRLPHLNRQGKRGPPQRPEWIWTVEQIYDDVAIICLHERSDRRREQDNICTIICKNILDLIKYIIFVVW